MKKYILAMILLSSPIFAQNTAALIDTAQQEQSNSNSNKKEERTKTLVGLTFDLGTTTANTHFATSNEDFYDYFDDFSPYKYLTFGLNMHFLTRSDLLVNLGIQYSGPFLLGNIGVGALRTVRNLPANILRVGGSLDVRLGYSFGEEGVLFNYNNSTIRTINNNFVIGIEPAFYLTYNNFMWGFSFGTDYLFDSGFSYFSSTKWGFMF